MFSKKIGLKFQEAEISEDLKLLMKSFRETTSSIN